MINQEEALNSIQKVISLPLKLQKKFSAGESGAYQVIDDLGHPYVLKTFSYPEAAWEIPKIQTHLEALQRRGYPAPQIMAITSIDESTIVLQEYLEGEALEPFESQYLSQIFALNQLQANLSATSSDWPKRILDTLLYGGQGYCLHESLEQYSTETKTILTQLKHIATLSTSMTSFHSDLVHFDFHGGNILANYGQICGVIDWAGACIGDRYFDLITLVYYYYLDPSIRVPVEAEILKHRSRKDLRLYYAHMILRQLDWSIRHHTAKAVDEYLIISQQILTDYHIH